MREFLKGMAASAIGTVIGLLALGFLVGVWGLGLLTYFLAKAAQETEPVLLGDSLLMVDLATDIQDGVPPSGPGVVLEETLSGSSTQALSIYQAVTAIKRAATDDNIVGVYIYGNSNTGFATLRELRQALQTVKEAGKPILAYEIDWSERDYYLVSAADKVMVDASGLLEFNGFEAETQFLTGALEKYGVGVQVLQAGRYKSAIEPFTRSENSLESQEQTQVLLGDLWGEFLSTIAETRSLPAPQLQQIADAGGLLLAPAAQESGLIDQAIAYEDVLTELQTLTGEDPTVGEAVSAIDLVAYSKLSEPTFNPDEIAVVYAAGDIVLGQSVEGLVGSDSLTSTLRDLRLDENVKAVVLRVNSPGGGATASEIIADAVARLQAEKPVVVSMGNVAASGGYMIASRADYIFASPNTITGSIGVFGLLLNLQDIGNRNGITWDVEKTAQFADIETLSRPQNPEEIALQQSIVNQLYDRFITLVAESRELPKATVNEVAQGRVWSGEDAVEAGLVDELGGLEAAIAYAAEQAELEDWTVSEYPRPRTLEAQIFDSLFGQFALRFRSGSHPLGQEFTSLQSTLQLLTTLEDPHGAYTRLPFTTEIK